MLPDVKIQSQVSESVHLLSDITIACECVQAAQKGPGLSVHERHGASATGARGGLTVKAALGCGIKLLSECLVEALLSVSYERKLLTTVSGSLAATHPGTETASLPPRPAPTLTMKQTSEMLERLSTAPRVRQAWPERLGLNAQAAVKDCFALCKLRTTARY